MRMSLWVLASMAAVLPLQTLAQSGSAPAAEFVPDPAAYGIVPKTKPQPLHVRKIDWTEFCDAKHEPKPNPKIGYSHEDMEWFGLCDKQPNANIPYRPTSTMPQARRQEQPENPNRPALEADRNERNGFVSQDAESQPYCGIYVGPEKRGIFDPVPDSGDRPKEVLDLLGREYLASARCVLELSAEDGNPKAIRAVTKFRANHVGEGEQIAAERAKRIADAEQTQRAQQQPAGARGPGLLGLMVLGWLTDGGNTSIAPDHTSPAWACSGSNDIQNCTTLVPGNSPQ
jgi:hypothetical protein